MNSADQQQQQPEPEPPTRAIEKEIDVYVHIHGLYAGNKLYPVEIGFSEVGKFNETRVVVVDLSDLQFQQSDNENNFLMYKKVHGICGPSGNNEITGNRPYGTPYKYLRTLIHLLYNRGTVFAVRGETQRKLLQGVLSDNYWIVDIGETFGFHQTVFVGAGGGDGGSCGGSAAPDFHVGFHSRPHEKNCAGKIAQIYATLLMDKIKFFEVSTIRDNIWYELYRQEDPRFVDRPYYFEDDDEQQDQQRNNGDISIMKETDDNGWS